MTITHALPDTGERQRVHHLRKRVPVLAQQYGWDPNSPTMRALAADEDFLTNCEEDGLRQLLDPYSSQNVYKSGPDQRPMILTPFNRKIGPSPISIAERHLTDGWESEWIGIAIESANTAFVSDHGEIIRFNEAGIGNSPLLVSAQLVIGHFAATFLPYMSQCGLMTALKMAVCDPQLGKAGLSYGPLLFVRRGEEWERRYC